MRLTEPYIDLKEQHNFEFPAYKDLNYENYLTAVLIKDRNCQHNYVLSNNNES